MTTDWTATRALFDLPDGVAYLDGNSLGPLPKSVPARLAAMLGDEWGRMAIGGWNRAAWMQMPAALGNRIAPLIGAAPDTVTLGDTLSIKVYQALSAALEMRPDRRKIVSDTGNFPTDLYMARGLVDTLGRGHELVVVDPEEVAAHLDDDVAAFMLTEVDYRTGRKHDMAALTARAHEAGIVAIWDLAHSAGALPIDVTASAAEFAVGCTYKYLNSGPGGPAFIYARPDIAGTIRPALQGWLGHDAPFDFDLDYRPAPGIARMRVGTPPVLQMAALDEALKVWEIADIHDVRARAIALGDRFIAGVAATCPELSLATPREPGQRGSQISFRHPEGYAIMQALIAEGVVGDFRAPDILRFGITPLYLGTDEIDRAVEILARIIATRSYDDPAFRARNAVT